MSAYKKLNANDVKITPFEAHKQYTINHTGTGSYGVSGSYSFFTASWTSESKDLFSDANRRYFQLDHLYYRDFLTTIDDRLDVSDTPYLKQERRLYEKANILSISQKNFGSGIQPGTFTLTGSFSGSQFNIKDDGYGNLYDDNQNVLTKAAFNSISDPRGRLLYLGPVNGFKKYDLTTDNNTGQTLVNPPSHYNAEGIYDDSYYLNQVKYKNIKFAGLNIPTSSIWPTIDFSSSYVQAQTETLAGNTFPSYVEVADSTQFDFSEDFSIVLRFADGANMGVNDFPIDGLGFNDHAELNQNHLMVSGARIYFISKNGEIPTVPTNLEGNAGLSLNTNTTGSSQIFYDTPSSQFPFELYYEYSSSLGGTATPQWVFKRSDGINTSIATASAAGNVGITNGFILLQKTGSNLELILDNSDIGKFTPDITTGNCNNKSPIYIGSKGIHPNDTSQPQVYTNPPSNLFQIQIFNKALSFIEILNLKTYTPTLTGTKTVGNIFYDSGIATITHPYYLEVLGNVSSSDDWTVTYKNTHLIYEHEITCTIAEDEFNQTRNITTRKIQSINSDELANFATGSLFKPYVTTVGLYNDEGDLLVVGKLGQPTRTSDETDTTFILRYDT
jgi:hypothetical protein